MRLPKVPDTSPHSRVPAPEVAIHSDGDMNVTSAEQDRSARHWILRELQQASLTAAVSPYGLRGLHTQFLEYFQFTPK